MSSIDRRTFLTSVAAGVAAGAAPLSGSTAESALARAQSSADSSALASPAFRPLPLGAIRPAGWLARQLRIQADGLSGHLDEFWPDVGQSQWFGGTAEGWERAPYWLDGVIPLAWALDDQSLKTRITHYIDYIVAHQRSEWKIVRGWAGELAPADAGLADPGKPMSDEPVEQISLIPYECTNIRITEFPKLREGATVTLGVGKSHGRGLSLRVPRAPYTAQFLILHDSAQPGTSPASDWTPKGLCKRGDDPA